MVYSSYHPFFTSIYFNSFLLDKKTYLAHILLLKFYLKQKVRVKLENFNI